MSEKEAGEERVVRGETLSRYLHVNPHATNVTEKLDGSDL